MNVGIAGHHFFRTHCTGTWTHGNLRYSFVQSQFLDPVSSAFFCLPFNSIFFFASPLQTLQLLQLKLRRLQLNVDYMTRTNMSICNRNIQLFFYLSEESVFKLVHRLSSNDIIEIKWSAAYLYVKVLHNWYMHIWRRMYKV